MNNNIQTYNIEFLNNNLDDSIHFYYFDEIDSTNNYARICIDNGEVPALIISESQTKGRGTNNRSFFSPKRRGIYMTYVVDIQNEKTKELITLAVANAIHLTLNDLGFPVHIKWINDLLCISDDKTYKISGILCEQYKSKIIIGIGINIYIPADEKIEYQEKENLPKSNSTHFNSTDSSSTTDFTGITNLYPKQNKKLLRENIIISILKNLNNELVKTNQDILSYYASNCLSLNHDLLIQNDEGELSIAKPLRLHNNGNLEVRINIENVILSDNQTSIKIIL